MDFNTDVVLQLITDAHPKTISEFANTTFNNLDKILEITPISKILIDKSTLSTPDQEIFLDNEESPSDYIEHDDDLELVKDINNDVIHEFDHTFDNHTYKEIVNHTISEGVLSFEIITIDGTKLHLPFSVLKLDHPCDYAKYISSYVIEGRRTGPKPHNTWASSFLK